MRWFCVLTRRWIDDGAVCHASIAISVDANQRSDAYKAACNSMDQQIPGSAHAAVIFWSCERELR